MSIRAGWLALAAAIAATAAVATLNVSIKGNMVATPDRRLYLACTGVNTVAVVEAAQ